LFSNLCLQWQTDLPRVFDECRRVLRAEGAVLASTFGRDTLIELRDAFAIADAGAAHVNQFDDIARVGDALLAAGFRNPVLERETFVLDYTDVLALMRELRGLGAGIVPTVADAIRAAGVFHHQTGLDPLFTGRDAPLHLHVEVLHPDCAGRESPGVFF